VRPAVTAIAPRLLQQPTILMRFSQLDRILSLKKGDSIEAVKCLSLSEEYLQDHFPRFPIMPGVLMVESMFQTSMWLLRATDEFRHSSVVLRQTKSLTFRDFVQPGNSLKVTAKIKSVNGPLTTLQVNGTIDDKPSVKGRLVLDTFNLCQRQNTDAAIDGYMNRQFRVKFRQLCSQMDKDTQAELMPKTPIEIEPSASSL
jgi:3-hydroxyacyl-[acyl-carrier-protein] dehydratase